MAESEVAQLMREINAAYQAAQWGLTGLASGIARHDFIKTKEERIALCHQELTILVGSEQATALVAEVYFQGEKKQEMTLSEKPVGEGA